MKKDTFFYMADTAVSVLIAYGIAIIIISFVSHDTLGALAFFITGPFDSVRHIGNVVEMAIPLAFTGLSFTILFKSNLFNLGAEGLFFSSALLTAVLAVQSQLPPFINPAALILAGGLLGAVLGCIPCVCNVRFGANTLVISLMMNYILYGVCMFFLNNKFRDITAYAIATPQFQASAKLARFVPGTRIHTGLIILVVCVVLITLFLNKAKWGYQMRMMGINKRFAAYMGMNSTAIMFVTHGLSGFLAGLGGSVEILGMYSKFQWTALPGYGLDGALIALLAKSNPLGILPAAVFIACIRTGADMMARMSDVPAEIVSIVQALIILLVSSQYFLRYIKERILLKEAQANG
jgi:simple sugar transport system permease protein